MASHDWTGTKIWEYQNIFLHKYGLINYTSFEKLAQIIFFLSHVDIRLYIEVSQKNNISFEI